MRHRILWLSLLFAWLWAFSTDAQEVGFQCTRKEEPSLAPVVGMALMHVIGEQPERFRITTEGTIATIQVIYLKNSYNFKWLRDAVIKRLREKGFTAGTVGPWGVWLFDGMPPVQRYVIYSNSIVRVNLPALIDTCVWEIPLSHAVNDVLGPRKKEEEP